MVDLFGSVRADPLPPGLRFVNPLARIVPIPRTQWQTTQRRGEIAVCNFPTFFHNLHNFLQLPQFTFRQFLHIFQNFPAIFPPSCMPSEHLKNGLPNSPHFPPHIPMHSLQSQFLSFPFLWMSFFPEPWNQNVCQKLGGVFTTARHFPRILWQPHDPRHEQKCRKVLSPSVRTQMVEVAEDVPCRWRSNRVAPLRIQVTLN